MTFEEISRYKNGKIIRGDNLELIFPDWRGNKERIVVLAPHDDDPLIGAGLLLRELINQGSEVYIAILTDGRKGYCRIDQKNNIISIRREETENAYECIGIIPYNIKRFELPDSDLYKHAYVWEYKRGKNNGLIAQLIEYFRDIRATRFLLPNENDFHIDHRVTFDIGRYCAIQASEKIVPDLGKPSFRNTILRYSVWSPFKGKPTHGIETSIDTLEKKLEGLYSYRSQEQIESIINEMENRGAYEFFKEYVVKSLPTEKYKKQHFPGNRRVKETEGANYNIYSRWCETKKVVRMNLAIRATDWKKPTDIGIKLQEHDFPFTLEVFKALGLEERWSGEKRTEEDYSSVYLNLIAKSEDGKELYKNKINVSGKFNPYFSFYLKPERRKNN